jgi:hypothetical protein
MQVDDHLPGIQPLLSKKGSKKWRVLPDDDAEALMDERFGKPFLVRVEASFIWQEDDRRFLPVTALV